MTARHFEKEMSIVSRENKTENATLQVYISFNNELLLNLAGSDKSVEELLEAKMDNSIPYSKISRNK